VSWFGVDQVSSFKDGERRTIDVDGVNVLIVNLGGEYFAVEDLCSHEAYALSGGTIEGGEIVCPFHGAKFCLKSGSATAAPAYEPIESFPVKVEDGVVFVRDHRWD
jgi:3-phenylpropionate/trans-cinnamate dioxygenase ferredoxin subunit